MPELFAPASFALPTSLRTPPTAQQFAATMGSSKARKRSSEARDAPAGAAGGAATFIADVTGALLQQSERPPYKRARAVVKGAVKALPDGALKSELAALLPAALKELKRSLGPTAVAADAQAEQLDLSSDAAYDAAVQRGEASQTEALLLARAPPHRRLLRQLLPVPERPTAEQLQRTARISGLIVASAGPADAAPVVRAALDVMARHHASLLDTLCADASASPLTQVRVVALTQQQRDAHAACCAALRQLAAILAAHSAVQSCASARPALRRRDSAAADPHDAVLQLALATCTAAVCRQLISAEQPRIFATSCDRLVVGASLAAEPLMLRVPVESMRCALLAAVPSDADTVPQARLARLSWLAAATAHGSSQLGPDSGLLSLEEVVFERQRARMFEAVGNIQGAAGTIDRLAARRTGGDLLQWLQARSSNAAAARCIAAAKDGSDPAALAHCLAKGLTMEDIQSLLDTWRTGSPGDGDTAVTGSGDADAAKDEDLFMMDGAGVSNWLNGPWPTAAGGDSSGDEEVAPIQGDESDEVRQSGDESS